ncbi:MAG TPA: insulinase family protein, partial [Polyangia bacterium]|nr:insulinase family protein [Polyangia bacterium]
PGGFGRDNFIAAFWGSIVMGNFSHGRFVDDPDIVDVSVATDSGPLAGMLICRIRLTEGTHPQQSVDRVLKYLPWIDDEMYLGRQFLRLKARALRHEAFAAETVDGRAERRADYLHFTGRLGYFGSVMDTITSIEADDALGFAKRYLGPDQAHAVFIEPLPPEQQTPPGTTGLGEGRTDDRPGPDQSLPGPTNDLPSGHRRLAGLRTVRLPNGLTLILVRRTTMPIVSINLGFRGGKLLAQPAAVADAAQIAVNLNLEESPSDYGIAFWPSLANDQWMTNVQAGIDNLPRALDMLAFSLKSFDVDWPSEKFRASTLPFLRRRDEDPRVRAARAMARALYGDHPLGREVRGDDIDHIGADAIERWFRAQRSPGNGALVIVGDIDLDKTEALARDELGGWSGPSDATELPAPPLIQAAAPPANAGLVAAADVTATPELKAIIVQDRPHATQVELSLNCLLPACNERRDAIDDVLSVVTQSELNQRIRIEAGASYGVITNAWNIRGGSAGLSISADVDNAHIGLALSTIARFMAERAARGFTAGEVAWSRFELNSKNLFENQSVSNLSGALLRNWNLGWPLEAVDRYPEYLAAVTTEDVHADMRTCAANQVLTLVGNQRAIEAGLRQAGLHAAPASR